MLEIEFRESLHNGNDKSYTLARRWVDKMAWGKKSREMGSGTAGLSRRWWASPRLVAGVMLARGLESGGKNLQGMRHVVWGLQMTRRRKPSRGVWYQVVQNWGVFRENSGTGVFVKDFKISLTIKGTLYSSFLYLFTHTTRIYSFSGVVIYAWGCLGWCSQAW